MIDCCSDGLRNSEAIAVATRNTPQGAVADDPLSRTGEWLRLVTQGLPIGLWSWNEVNQRFSCDHNTREMFGAPAEGEVDLETFCNLLHPTDRDRVVYDWRRAFTQALPYDLEYRSRKPDGTSRWIHARGTGCYDDTGTPLRMIGVVFDLTESKDVEQTCQDLSGRLIHAQEEERTRVARELHDDFSQRFAVLSNQLELVRRMIPENSREARKRLRQMQNGLSEIGTDLHTLSHRLHSSKLEYLGLAATVKSYCADIQRQYPIQIKLKQNVPQTMPAGTPLCLFRIVQEGLRNVIKHSQATKVDVVLREDTEVISLTISDNGVGFEASNRLVYDGIGLLSMRERARMLGGTFKVRSEPTRGTQIAVTVPLSGNSPTQPDRGSRDRIS